LKLKGCFGREWKRRAKFNQHNQLFAIKFASDQILDINNVEKAIFPIHIWRVVFTTARDRRNSKCLKFYQQATRTF
jgi:hypothetical protein